MKRILVWDLPVRVFHWLLAGSFVGAFLIANVVDDESSLFAVHMWLGGIMVAMVLMRLIWGLLGTRYARFRSFAQAGPRALWGYVRGTLKGEGEGERHVGHNPGSSLAAYLIFALVLGLGITGAFMSSGGEAFEEVHEVLAWLLLGTVVVHVAGIVWHTVRHRENIARSMVDGRKVGDSEAAIPSARPVVALVFLAVTGLWAGGLYAGYDGATNTVRLPLIGQSLQLGEDEEHEEHEYGGRYEEDEHGEYEEDDD